MRMFVARLRCARQAKSVTLSGVGLHNAQYIVGPCVNRYLLSGGIYRLLCGAGQCRKDPPFQPKGCPVLAHCRGYDAGDRHLVDALYRHAVDADADDDAL